MIPIKHILYEDGVKEIFKIIVPNGAYQGEYIISKPEGWDDTDSVVNIDEELFFVKDFIIGENVKLKFYQYADTVAYNVLSNVYKEQAGDGRIIFKWIGVKDGIEYDLLKDNFEVNLNKYSTSFDNSMLKIEIELAKSEAQNKLFNRDDVSVDIFGTKDLDENAIDPVETFETGYKKGAIKQSNFYTWDISQNVILNAYRTDHFFSFVRSSDYQLGDNTNEYAGFKYSFDIRIDQGPFIHTSITLKTIKVEISNMHVICQRADLNFPNVWLVAVIKNGNTLVSTQNLIKGEQIPDGLGYSAEFKIGNKIFELSNPSNLAAGQSLSFAFMTDNVDDKFRALSVLTNTSIEISTNLEYPMVKTRGVRIIDAVKQVVKNYTASGLGVISNYIGPGGTYYNTSISTGVYLRGLPDIYTAGQKIKTSLKSIFTDGLAKLLVLGYDIINNDVVIEDIKYFFKDHKVYDLSEKKYIQEEFKIENDKDVVFNTMLFGSKKYSKNVKDDIQNFITSSELSTPIKSAKNKFDKQTDLIIDEYKIQELIEDKSSSTNENDDDLVLIDLINKTNYWDTGVFDNCIHTNKNGKLVLTCVSTPFDTTMMTVGYAVEILEGLNIGTHYIIEIKGSEIVLDTNSAIQTGTIDTPIRYLIPTLTKNRVIADSFIDINWVRNPETSTNSRHNPKYHMARWFQWFGSGLNKKLDSEIIKVTNYKNNDKAQMETNSSDLSNELTGIVIVGENETIGRLRDYSSPLFSGDKIEISFLDVTFNEFITMYESWRYGIGNRMDSRGYFTLNTPMGLLNAYPFGDGALSHNRKTNVLSFKGKIKG
ncbi:hypothetical protein EG359_17480 [Chryseobacterium joostei]|uniref:Uncharacterized protein n=1 Tax=Chryseobacterium joostei TaxID=112234 RepID=A0A1N7IB53_9FLAO|nr:hypothetical protein [Chryseobacterium joostei]AZB01296.1 hypothetical protein EG359_17480 [Chryseobacterium joostei]SIS34314.1 hypothetical protein SAMN05421768_103697 [Chryseobacterium joostei]